MSLMMKMAYAIGMTNNRMEEEKDKSCHVSIKLGTVFPEWEGYKLVHYIRPSESKYINDSYALFYDGPFGNSNCCSCLGHVDAGWSLDHLCHIMKQFIELHQAEIRKNKD